MANPLCLLAGIVVLLIGIFLLFTDAGNEFFEDSRNPGYGVGIRFYAQFISYTLFLSGLILVIRAFMKWK